MFLNELDDFFAMPMFGYGLFTKASVFPFTISLKFSSSKYMRIQFLDKSNDRWCVCDNHHVYHIINPKRVQKVVFYDDLSGESFEGEQILELMEKVNDKVKINVSYEDSQWPPFVRVRIDNKYERGFKKELGKCSFAKLMTYFYRFLNSKE